MPVVIPLTYAFLLPPTLAFASLTVEDEDDTADITSPIVSPYAPIPTGDEDDRPGFTPHVFSSPVRATDKVALTAKDKWALVRPLLPKYMLPLCEYP